MSSILTNESPIFFQTVLAMKIGVNEAIFIEKLRYLLNPKFNKNIRKGKNWVYNTYAQWLEIFPFWSERTLRRAIDSSEKQGFVMSCYMCRDKSNRTKWYTLNYEKLDSLSIGTSGQSDQMDVAKVDKWSGQSDQMLHVAKMDTSIYTNNTQESLSKNINKKGNTKYLEDIPSTKGDFCIPSDYIRFDSLVESVSRKEDISERSKKAKNDVKENNLKINNDFNEFWENYPIKVEKDYALKCFKQATTKTSLEKILTALRSQKEERSERERLGLWIPPWKNPSTWLNKGCWNNIPKTLEELEREKEEQMSRFKKTKIDKEDEDMKKLNKILEGCL